MREPSECLRCRGPMERGFVMDRGHANSPDQQEWVEGEPDRRWWGIRTKDKDRFKVHTFRCDRCGWLESYANPD